MVSYKRKSRNEKIKRPSNKGNRRKEREGAMIVGEKERKEIAFVFSFSLCVKAGGAAISNI